MDRILRSNWVGVVAFALAISLIGMVGLWIAIELDSSGAGIAFVGVLIGTAVSVLTQTLKSESDYRQQLRMAALEKRLNVHQEAFALWRRLLFVEKANKTAVDELVVKCQDWADVNCLFLTPDAELALRHSWRAVTNLADLHSEHGPVQELRSETAILKRAGDVIRAGVNLPSIGDDH